MGPRRSQLALLLTVLAAVFRAGSTADCTQCSPEPSLFTCPLTEGCIDGGSATQKTGDDGCSIFKCNDPDEAFIVTQADGSILPILVPEIKCDDRKIWVEGFSNGPVTEAVCIKGFSCATKSQLTSNCDSSLAAFGCVRVQSITTDNPETCDTGKKQFFKFENMPWEALPDGGLMCDIETGLWEDQSTNKHPRGQVICADSIPTPSLIFESCKTSSRALTSSCPSLANQCHDVRFDDYNLLRCLYSGTKFYVQAPGALPWIPAKDNMIKCDALTGQWKEGSTQSGQLMPGSNVVCATDDPSTGVCPQLKHDCEASWETQTPAVGCSTPPDLTAPVCNAAAGDKLYFKRGANKNFQEATSIICNGGKWELTYNFGANNPLKEELVAGDHLICAKSNPHPIVCKYINVKYPGMDLTQYSVSKNTAKGVEAGKEAECPTKNDQFYSSLTGEIRSLAYPPMCSADGRWVKYELRGSDLHLVDFGKEGGEAESVGCRTVHCKMCKIDPPTVSIFVAGDKQQYQYDNNGECATITCSTDKYMIIKGEDQPLYQYYSGEVICDHDKTSYKFDKRSKTVEQINCVQFMPCAHPKDPDDQVLKAKFVCPIDIPADQGCVNPILSGTDNKYLECNNEKKMFVKGDSEVWWYEITTKKITCEIKRGEWQMTLLGQTAADKEFRGPENTFICADQNPNPEPPPTTTTAPAEIEICELCQTVLNNTCPDCIIGTNVNLVPIKEDLEKNIKEKCQMTPFSKKFSLLTSGTSEILDVLTCERPVKDEDTGKIPDPVWKDKNNNPVANFLARREKDVQKWVGGQYGILAGALFIIGGMGFGCVFIYFRMRKQPSVREKKKKERGVTKKYTSANVVKTGGRSDTGGSREGGKSREPTKSTNESNLEDAPTLKL